MPFAKRNTVFAAIGLLCTPQRIKRATTSTVMIVSLSVRYTIYFKYIKTRSTHLAQTRCDSIYSRHTQSIYKCTQTQYGFWSEYLDSGNIQEMCTWNYRTDERTNERTKIILKKNSLLKYIIHSHQATRSNINQMNMSQAAKMKVPSTAI